MRLFLHRHSGVGRNPGRRGRGGDKWMADFIGWLFGSLFLWLSFPRCGNGLLKPLDSGLRRNDGGGEFRLSQSRRAFLFRLDWSVQPPRVTRCVYPLAVIPAKARLHGCRAFGEFSRAVVERRLEQAAEESRKRGQGNKWMAGFIGWLVGLSCLCAMRLFLHRHSGEGRNPGGRGRDFKPIPLYPKAPGQSLFETPRPPRPLIPNAVPSPYPAFPRLKRQSSPMPRSAVYPFQRIPARVVFYIQ